MYVYMYIHKRTHIYICIYIYIYMFVWVRVCLVILLLLVFFIVSAVRCWNCEHASQKPRPLQKQSGKSVHGHLIKAGSRQGGLLCDLLRANLSAISESNCSAIFETG